MLGFLGPRYDRSRAVSLWGDRVCKQVAPSLTAVQAEMTRRAGRLGRRSGLFRVPKVLRTDVRAGWIELERLEGLVSLGRMIDRTGNGLPMLGQAGRALAHIHEHLEVPTRLRKPARFQPGSTDALVGIHGDFNTMNVSYQPSEGVLVILDWACAKPFGSVSTVGTRYLDISLMLRSLVIHQANLLQSVRRFRLRASAFLEGYQEQWQRPLDPGRLSDALLHVSRLYLRSPTTSNVFWKKCMYGLAAMAGHLTVRRVLARWRHQPPRARKGPPDAPKATIQPQDQLGYRSSHTSAEKAASYDASFDHVAFRALMWKHERQVLDRILHKYHAGRPMRHLDFACGTGRILRHLHGRTRSSTGIDISPSMIELARRKVPQAELIVGDVTREDLLAGRTFDLITVFRFFPNAEAELRGQVMQALARHLSSNGLMVFNNHRCDSGSLFRLGRLLGKRSNTMRLEEMTELVRAGGLDIVEVFPIGTLPATDRHMLVPGWVHGVCDRLVGEVNMSTRLAQNVVFVCRPADTAAAAGGGRRKAREAAHA